MSIAKVKCGACRTDVALPAFTMAFQPIVHIDTGDVYAYEALVRPLGGGSAADVLSQINGVYGIYDGEWDLRKLFDRRPRK